MRITKIYLLLALAIFSCADSTSVQETADLKIVENIITLSEAQYKISGIQIARPQNRSIASILKLNGKIDVPPQNLVSVSVPLGGYLRSTRLMPGMHVNKGDVLAILEDVQYIQLQQDYLTAKTQLALNETEFLRQRELNVTKATSDKTFEQARANYETAEILVSSLKQQLALIGINSAKITHKNISKSIHLYSPIGGFVSAVNVNVGKYVTPSDILFELVNPNDIHLAMTVFEKDLSKLSLGQKLIAYTNSNPSKKYPCEIILISKSLSLGNAAIVHCHFEKYDNTLLPGTFINAEVETSNHTSITLPQASIVRFENKQYVFAAVGNNKFEMREVKIGPTENGFTEIQRNNKWLNENFVTKGAYSLLMAMKNSGEEE